MIAGTIRATRCGTLAALLFAALLAGCASTAQPGPTPEVAAGSERLMRMADKAKERGELPVAASLYRQAHDADPNNIKPLVALGQVLMDMRDPRQASAVYSAALLVDGANVDALRGYGNARLALHDPEQAIPSLKQAFDRSANDFRILNALGVAFDMSGDHPGAQQFYRSGLKLAPDNAALRSNYALSLALSGQTDQALEILKPLSDARAITVQQRETMALVYGLSGNMAEAERLSRMDLDEASVKANMKRIAAMRTASAPANASSAAPTVIHPAVQPVAAVESDPLPAPATPTPAAPLPLPAADSSVIQSQPVSAGAVIPAAATVEPMPEAHIVAPQDSHRQEVEAATVIAYRTPPVEAATSSGMSEPKPETAAAIKADPQGDRAWLVQLASYHRQEQADTGWREISAAAPELLGNVKPRVDEGHLADNSVVWRLRMGPYGSVAEADKMCRSLKAHGIACFVAPL